MIMRMNSAEIRACQNCKQPFAIQQEDFSFYAKVNVPPPTFCPECRLVRRLMWRNERALYKRTCALCNGPTLSVYHPQSAYVVYCVPCWWSDKWDPLSYGREYDFGKPFFEQYRELFERVPRAALVGKNSVNCEYANYLENAKNAYLSYSVVYDAEDVWYSKNIDHSRRILDSFDVSESEQCYQNIAVSKNYNCQYAQFSHECIDCAYIFDCINCQNCILCTAQRNKRYCVRNKQLTKEEYEREAQRIKEAGYQGRAAYAREFEGMKQASIRKFAWTKNVTASTGDDIRDSKNLVSGFSCYGMENVKFAFRCVMLKDSMDATNAGRSELYYEFMGGGGTGSTAVRFCTSTLNGLDDVQYVDYCGSSSNLFGCVGLRSKNYCILNRQYSKEEYGVLVPKIVAHMNEMPYTDKRGRIYKYGEFFPAEISPFAYNETVAQEYFPLERDKAMYKGYRWRDPEKKEYAVTVQPGALPDRIDDADDSILQDIIGCAHKGECNEQCTTAFKVVREELGFYRRMNLPLPRLCPNCRHYERLAQRNPLKLWHRKCQCKGLNQGGHKNTAAHFHNDQPCPNEFETSYAPERQETVYCEQCYQAEVV